MSQTNFRIRKSSWFRLAHMKNRTAGILARILGRRHLACKKIADWKSAALNAGWKPAVPLLLLCVFVVACKQQPSADINAIAHPVHTDSFMAKRMERELID